MPLELTILFLGQVSSPEQTLGNYIFLLIPRLHRRHPTHRDGTRCSLRWLIGALKEKCRVQESTHDQISLIQSGVPRALPGRQSNFENPGVSLLQLLSFWRGPCLAGLMLLLFIGLRGQQPKASGSAGGALLRSLDLARMARAFSSRPTQLAIRVDAALGTRDASRESTAASASCLSMAARTVAHAG
jgi:hypothetical protein